MKSVVQVFNPTNRIHLQGFQTLLKTCQWSDEFYEGLEEFGCQIDFPHGYKEEITLKICKAYLEFLTTVTFV